VGYLLPKSRLRDFLSLLARGSSFVAPLRRESDGVVVFEAVERDADLERLDLSTNPQFSAKKFFMPASETLFEYDMEGQRVTDRKAVPHARILFGLRLCDLNSVKIQDKLFLGRQFVDDHYRAARDHVFLVGWYCNTPLSQQCFCESMKLTNYYDLLLRELPEQKEFIYIDIGSPKGVALLKKAGHLHLEEHHEPVPAIKTQKHLETHDIRKHFENPQWKVTTEAECLSCQRCTTMCPTCMCFDIYDTTKQDLRHGSRERTWDSCHSKEFTRVAGGHIFRPDRTARFKHRVYHKIAYYPEAFGTPMCTGCGRCIEQCPSTIDFVEIINRMEAEARK
jgi:sulfhydrogenase subunit beta (sulfur reductase)